MLAVAPSCMSIHVQFFLYVASCMLRPWCFNLALDTNHDGVLTKGDVCILHFLIYRQIRLKNVRCTRWHCIHIAGEVLGALSDLDPDCAPQDALRLFECLDTDHCGVIR